MAKITRNPFDSNKFGFFVSEWYGYNDGKRGWRPGVIVAWQGQNDSEPRLLLPSEFIRANEQTKSVDFLVAGQFANTADVKWTRLYGKVKIRNATMQSCGKCIAQMQKTDWWKLDPLGPVYHKIAGGTAPYTKEEIELHRHAVERDTAPIMDRLLG